MSKEICILNGTKWILGDESTEPMNWEDANKWCKSIGQDLPPREVLLMAFLNPEIRSNFANKYYWSSSELDSYIAWYQNFNAGNQNYSYKNNALPVRAVRAISAEASEQTEQKPVAWMYDHFIKTGHEKQVIFDIVETCARNLEFDNCINIRPLYTAPPKREPLSEERMIELWNTCHSAKKFARAIEKAHGIRE